METTELFQRLTLALAIGLLIGIERGWQSREEGEGERSIGLRTLALTGLLGGVWGVVAGHLGEGGGAALAVAFAVLGGTVVLFRYRETQHDGTFGVTTAVAALLAFALGALAAIGDMAAAAAAGVAVAGLLALKGLLHGWIRRLTWPELRSVLMLAAMTTILLPILTNRTIDPLGTINPFEIWLLTVMIAVIAFAGYVAIKLTGDRRGIALTGLAGGLASSTAVTLTLARLARAHPERRDLLVGGALLAGATMMARVTVVLAVVKTALLARVALPLLAAAAVMAASALVLLLRPGPDRGSESEFAPVNPIDFPAVLKFGVLLTTVGFLVRLATLLAGSTGVFVLAAISGLADVDAITLSMARLGGGSLSLDVAAGAVLIAVGVNTLAKAAMAWMAGGSEFGTRMAMVGLLALAVGLAGYLLGPLPLEGLLALRPG